MIHTIKRNAAPWSGQYDSDENGRVSLVLDYEPKQYVAVRRQCSRREEFMALRRWNISIENPQTESISSFQRSRQNIIVVKDVHKMAIANKLPFFCKLSENV